MSEFEQNLNIDSGHRNQDPVTGGFDPMEMNPEMTANLRGRLPRRGFLRVSGLTAAAAALAACAEPFKQAGQVLKTAEAFTPDPTRVAELVEKKRRKAAEEDSTETPATQEAVQAVENDIFNTPETGIYNAEALARWQELEPQPKIDEKIGISIHPSRYVRGKGSLRWHTDVAAKLGFQRVAVPISPPEFTDHTGIELGRLTLDQLAKYEEFDYLFAHPEIKAIHVTCDVGGIGTANGWQFPNEGAFNQDRLQATYEEYYRFAEHLLVTYGHLGKEITIGGPNEIELLAKGGPYDGAKEDQDISQTALDNAIKYFSVVHQAVRDANGAHPDKTALTTGLEVLQIRTEFKTPDSVTGMDVVKGLPVKPDDFTLSAWQFSGKGEGGYWPRKTAELMRQVAQKVSVTEFGIADRDLPGVDRNGIANLYRTDIEGFFAGGATSVVVWGLTGYNADKNFPNSNEERGLGLIRPDGSFRREVYETLRQIK